ncbi:Aste57867_1985 [Aphanomyces stellatus]|uniref:Aste57867_1985 protein n=1 Tax=Aphanomyces stellatus TaxID=120398 RepID=A0A485KBN5_9STRA|nr:hypothetical protein As57867_001983 [Aphanomyces stellatus]VFT79190.1 Aste57867_1985 [Aphanomyces stellatus]
MVATPPEPLLGILGGVGPAAGLVLHQTILHHTLNGGTDQGHLNVLHISRSADIAARPDYLHQHGQRELTTTIENPAVGMTRNLRMLERAAKVQSAKLIVGVPCNTFHASPIWTPFEAAASKSKATGNIVVLHILKETVRFIGDLAPSARTIGVLSTTGSRMSRIYHDLLEPAGYRVVQVPEADQHDVNDTIYNLEWGIKSTSPAIHPRATANLRRFASLLAQVGAQVLILGCTELPMALTERHVNGMLVVDPMVALARAMIREADPAKLVPLEVFYKFACKPVSEVLGGAESDGDETASMGESDTGFDSDHVE